jgi:hypothetical protein
LLASRTGRFTPRERAPGTHWIGSWVGPRAVLDAVVKRTIPSSRRESNPTTDRPARSLVAIPTKLSRLLNFTLFYLCRPMSTSQCCLTNILCHFKCVLVDVTLPKGLYIILRVNTPLKQDTAEYLISYLKRDLVQFFHVSTSYFINQSPRKHVGNLKRLQCMRSGILH